MRFLRTRDTERERERKRERERMKEAEIQEKQKKKKEHCFSCFRSQEILFLTPFCVCLKSDWLNKASPMYILSLSCDCEI